MKNKIHWLITNLLLASIILTGVSLTKKFDSNTTKVFAASNTILYTSDTSSFPNPERGMYSQLAFSNDEAHNYTAQDLIGVRQSYNISTFRVYYFIDSYITTPFPQSFLDKLNDDATKFRQAGLKFMPTFTYVPDGGTTDASVAQILTHIDQITPFLQLNSDVIAAVYAGFVGDFGEWHDSLAGNLGTGISTNSNSQAIVNKLLTALPNSRSILLRYPLAKRQITNDALPISVTNAFDRSKKSRIGHQNDSLMSGVADRGTYDFDQNGAFALDIEGNRSYVNTDGAFVPNSGESGDLADLTYQNCNAARPALAALHQDFIHDKNYYPGDGSFDYGPATGGKYPLTATLQSEGCFEEVAQKLGYRIRLIDSTINNTLVQNSNLSVNLRIKNDGYASPFNTRNLEVVLRNITTGTNYRVNALSTATDPRLWFPEKGEFLLDLNASLINIPAGNYSVLLNLPDPEPNLNNRADYSIRFANTNMWEPSTGFNNLQQTLIINALPVSTPCSAGNYSSTGSSPCLPCPQNTYCSTTSTITPTNCPATYLSSAGSTSIASCIAQVCSNGATNPSSCNSCSPGQSLNSNNICVVTSGGSIQVITSQSSNSSVSSSSFISSSNVQSSSKVPEPTLVLSQIPQKSSSTLDSNDTMKELASAPKILQNITELVRTGGTAFVIAPIILLVLFLFVVISYGASSRKRE